jgi:hypothetical protein
MIAGESFNNVIRREGFRPYMFVHEMACFG